METPLFYRRPQAAALMEFEMKQSSVLKGKLRILIYWPALLLPVMIIASVLVMAKTEQADVIMLIFLCLYLVFTIWWVLFWKDHLMGEVVGFSEGFNEIQRQQLEQLPLPYVLVDENGRVLWVNTAFKSMSGEDARHLGQIAGLFPELADVRDAAGGELRRVNYKEKIYDVGVEELTTDEPVIALSFTDVTEHLRTLQTIEEQKPAIGRIYIDNYDEVMGSTELVRRSLLEALIERKLTKYFGTYDGIVRKLDKDKYSLAMNKRSLKKVEEDRFSILEDIKSVSIGNEIQATISIGIGVDGETMADDDNYSTLAVDLCLGRGGDQAIVRTPEGPSYYGGKVQQQEKSTRVKARVKAQALREILASRERIFIMGHKLSDQDAVGAAIGIRRIVRAMEKKAYIVLEDITSSMRPVIDVLTAGPEGDSIFINREKALAMINENDAVVVVDVNRGSYCECPELLAKNSNVIVLDHHRQTTDSINNAILSYIEPYASSAVEMIAEILQYIPDEIRLSNAEADAMYAGLVVDTDNFVAKTGVRTFEAAAYLRRCGADMTRVRKLLRDSLDAYKMKAQVISTAELFDDHFAFGECVADGIESPTIVGAQAANDLLDIEGVKASFIFTKVDDTVFISARSIDEINVQLVMERLGGGGHLSTAGAQLKGCSVEEAMAITKETLLQMIEEGAI